MTVIAFKDGILAADSQIVCDGLKSRGLKLIKRSDTIIGICGDFQAGLVFIDWYFDRESRRPEMAHEEFAALVYSNAHGLQWWNNSLRPQSVGHPFFAIGAGAHIAIGAMAAGKSARRAVEIACEWADGCSLPIISVKI